MRRRGIIEILIAVLLALVGGALIGFLVRKFLGEARVQSAESAAKRLLEDAEKQAERRQKEALLEVKDEIHGLRKETERELKERRNELQGLERRVIQKEEALDNRILQLDRREEGLRGKEDDLLQRRDQLDRLIDDEKVALERISGMSGNEAKDLLLKRVEEEIKHESAQLIREVETRAREEADRRAQNIVSLAIQRCASDQVAEMTVSVVNLPGDEMKGRIIGREGRNIRAIETLTGINLIIDDTPEAVIISGFDPVRREIARLTLEKLIADGRIHPARIEEMFEKARSEVDSRIREAGEAAALETDVHNLHPELIKVLGRLHYRTSYGQNVLKHIIEATHIAGMMAAEMGVDARLVKRATLLHDVGKAVDHEIEGSHASIGADLAKRLGESPAICHAIAAHHGETEPQTVEAVLVQAADAVSAARPGARRETLESYIKRLEKLEGIAESYEGVEKSYAMQAGREIRIMVRPEQVDDDGALLLARSIARQIEDELVYPGQIKVTVIRENRAVEYAK